VAEPPEREPTSAGPEPVVPTLDRLVLAPEPVVPAPEPAVVAPEPVVLARKPVALEPPCPPAGLVVCVELVGPVVSVELLELELVGGIVELVDGGVVVGGTVLVVAGRRRGREVGGALVVEVVAWLVRETTTTPRERVVVVSPVEVAGETWWRCGSVVAVVWAVASAACLGEVAKPTMLPPIAPISIAVATLTHRRAATNATGLKRRTPPGSRVLNTMISASDRFCAKILYPVSRRPAGRARRPAGRAPGHHESAHHEQRREGAAVVGETSGSALDRWREELEAWAIPDEIIERAPESPWGFPVGMFRARAEQARGGEPTPSNLEALRFLGEGGTVLDVGAGAGAASLPLAGSARRIVAVDESPGMIEAFLAAAGAAGVEAGAVLGRWPDVADQVDPADVVVCNDVLYNVQDLGPFALSLTDHARRRVVVQITSTHPLAPMRPLWRRFHGLERPEGPTADGAVAALAAVGLGVERHDWTTSRAGSFERLDDLVAFMRRRLCLPASRDPEIAGALEPIAIHEPGGYRLGPIDRPVVTLSWPGTA
jgi:SAM-dependent methyltransferase